MKTVILFFQHINREIDMCRSIKNEIKSMSCGEVSVGIFSIDFEWVDAIKYAKRRGVDVVVMPWLRIDEHEGLIAPFLKINQGLSVLSFDHEQISSPLSMQALLPSCEFARSEVIHLAWSDFFSQQLIDAGVKEKNIIKTGNARLDALRQSTKTRAELSREFSLDSQKKWILFAENRSYVREKTILTISDHIASGIPEQTVYDRLSFLSSSLDAFEKQINALSPSFFDDYEFIYRTHPGQSLNIKLPSEVKAVSDYPISAWLHNIDALLTFGSTSAFEADAVGIPVFVHMPVPEEPDYMTFGIMEYIVINELDSLSGKALATACEFQNRNHIYEKYVGEADGQASKRVAEAIIEMTSKRQSHAVKANLHIKEMTRKVLFELLTKIMVKTKALEKTKYPRNAYRERKDIPYYIS